MPEISLLLWDVGGVLLTNAWDREERTTAVAHFGLDADDLERRHGTVVEAFEAGHLTLDEYLARTVFYEPRPFSPADFHQFMRAQSRPHPTALATARSIRHGGRYVMAALNNESRELNEFRIRTFELNDVFHAYFSSCYTGHRKPEPSAYRSALMLAQRTPEETLFLDDRPENIAAAEHLGLRTLEVRDPGKIREELALAGVASA